MNGCFRYVARVPRALLVLVALLATALVATPSVQAPAYAVTCVETHDSDVSAPRTANSRRLTERRPAPRVVPTRSAPRNACPQRCEKPHPQFPPHLRTVVLRC